MILMFSFFFKKATYGGAFVVYFTDGVALALTLLLQSQIHTYTHTQYYVTDLSVSLELKMG